MADERKILINLVASMSLADHMGDVFEDCVKALKDAGIDWPGTDDGMQKPLDQLTAWLVTHHGAESVWGTPLAED